MKRILSTILFCVLMVSLTSCYKSETITFTETTYALKEQVTFDESRNLDDVKLKLTEIPKEEYSAANKTNVIISRYDDKCYKIELTLKVDGVSYDHFTIREISGSSAYPNRYRFVFDLQIDGKVYPCNFRMDLHHYKWEAEGIKEDKATSIRVDMLKAIDENGITDGSCFATFWLITQRDAI